MHLFVSCQPKFESLLIEELNTLGITARAWPPHAPRGASAPLSMENVYRINMESRIATRVLWPLKNFKVHHREELYKQAGEIEWEKYLSVDDTFAIDANVFSSPGFQNSHFASLVVKDAICDRFRNTTGQRPSVNLQTPTIQLNLFIYKDVGTISLDTSGTPLFKRGYRLGSFATPLQETVAAAILKFARYTPDDILCDPFCGSGTFLWEAALMATHTPPGFFRDQFGFFKCPEFSETTWNNYLASVQSRRTPLRPFSIFGADRDLKAVEICRNTGLKAGLNVHLQHSDIRFFKPPQLPTLVVANPPYGHRTPAFADPYTPLAHFLENSCQGKARAAILTPLQYLPSAFKRRTLESIPFQNGGLDVFLHLY